MSMFVIVLGSTAVVLVTGIIYLGLFLFLAEDV